MIYSQSISYNKKLNYEKKRDFFPCSLHIDGDFNTGHNISPGLIEKRVISAYF